jgi:hypothetical protein
MNVSFPNFSKKNVSPGKYSTIKSKTNQISPLGEASQSINHDGDEELERHRKTPVLHMQFDELASN